MHEVVLAGERSARAGKGRRNKWWEGVLWECFVDASYSLKMCFTKHLHGPSL